MEAIGRSSWSPGALPTLTFDLVSKNSNPYNRLNPRPIKKMRGEAEQQRNPFDSLTEEILFLILDRLGSNPVDKKSFSLVCKSFYAAESRHRRTLAPLRSDLLRRILARYPSIARLDFTLCPRVTDGALAAAADALRSSLRSVDLSRSKAFSSVGLEKLAVNCTSLVEIDLSYSFYLNDGAAAAIGRARNLERLWLAKCRRITDIGIARIALGCPKLRLLCLNECIKLTDLGIELVASKCKMLQSLDLSYLAITEKCLPAILQLPYLEDLSLPECVGVDALSQGCTSLEVLDMSIRQQVFDIATCQHAKCAGLSSITNRSLGLRQMGLTYYIPVTCFLQKLPRLQSIKLSDCEITSTELKAIGTSCLSLKELSFSKCSGITDEDLSFIVSKHRDLLKLDITCCSEITDVSLANITSSCTSLTSLRMESCNLVSKEGFRLIGQRCHLLEELDLTDTDLDNEGLKAVSGCFKLSSLKIGLCMNINDEGLVHVGKCCPKLQVLDLYRCTGITDMGISAIGLGCPVLRMINLAYCSDITDDSLRSLSKCLNLDTLEIRGCPQVSSVGISAIAVGCRQLTKLDVKKCYDINDDGMLSLGRFSQNLRQINLSYCSVTDRGLLALASISCLQNMTILHLKGLTPNGLKNVLWACNGLRKMKLHSSLKSLIPQHILEYTQARGCMFQWSNKPYQAELVPNEIWKQQSRGMPV
ncbi:F-box/LRR-repeat protein 3 [Elaeis guineensis]|uniref:F-box/LRR-repeat protein 3 n=1 Tax=Elaeis guineensis var. tenera TaxID=51953 RepID=A0A6J0PKS4_ELAGV|nr:F-box/LRR-repeat protein 3 [Elaeis guineensis]